MKCGWLLAVLLAAPLGCPQTPVAGNGAQADQITAQPSGQGSKPIRFEEEKPITVTVESPQPVMPGGKAVLRFHFEPRDTIKVPKYPPAYLEDLEILGDVPAPRGRTYAREFTAEEEEAASYQYYEGAPPPLELSLALPGTLTAGTYPFRGQVHYFFCYETGGICAKEQATVEGVIDVLSNGNGAGERQ